MTKNMTCNKGVSADTALLHWTSYEYIMTDNQSTNFIYTLLMEFFQMEMCQMMTVGKNGVTTYFPGLPEGSDDATFFFFFFKSLLRAH